MKHGKIVWTQGRGGLGPGLWELFYLADWGPTPHSLYMYCFSMLGILFYPADGGISSSEMLVTINQISQCHTPEDGTLQNLFVLCILSGLMKPGVKLLVFVYIFVMYGFKNWNLLLYSEEFSSFRRFISCHHSNLIPWELTIYYSMQMDIFIHVLILWPCVKI